MTLVLGLTAPFLVKTVLFVGVDALKGTDGLGD
jgi:hypothetical protein